MNGAESIVRTLVATGVEVCFTKPGMSEMHISHIASQPGVRFTTLAELAALTLASGMAAEGDRIAPHQATLNVTPYRGDLAVKPI